MGRSAGAWRTVSSELIEMTMEEGAPQEISEETSAIMAEEAASCESS